MDLALSFAMSFFALLATFYQAHLQRVHNQKSVKPLPQIDLMDRDGVLFVHVQNNGVGPMIVDRLVFTRGGKHYYRIQDCLDIDPKSYYHVEVTDTNKKVLIPGGFLQVFSEPLDPQGNQGTIALFQKQLAALHLKVEGHDIYNNRISVEKSLSWFARHL
ncbi:hypothetical protein [Mucilaginibacter phyllosphaerae]|uniref:Uncharacterized protein n=1 Tax=Mucilaginibacter phyllosphaerae TaxID=1812349 RepID=A0A4Y8ABF6_9SPHI|nr:hypothetical protein [Mucilaginibacter phyllosphaerae]MBB3969323.1 hypothetical protein [Mucilaginibacter phyllosphaerae]TEW65884.1 hypothetical protein E2R65_12170 [Mucilaginibacter phyllosphaerae]GGH07691.1 hypothetical protein GCM10007352_12550 [Mucilaginibacter phyllosphaerae]